MTKNALNALFVLAALPMAVQVSAADWLQFGNDAAHSGVNAAESAIQPGNVASLAAPYAPVTLPGKVDSAPVYASGIVTANGTRNLLFTFATSSLTDHGMTSTLGTLLAIDAESGDVVWSKTTTGSDQHASSSPAIDPARTFVYSFGLDGYVHKYAIADGSEVDTGGPTGWPQQVTLKPDVEKVASGLTIATGATGSFLEVVTDGYNGDGGDYQGHLVSIDLGSGARKVFNFMCSTVTTLLANGGCPSGRMSGAWGRGGATVDVAASRIYVTSGNGKFNANTTGGHNWGDSVLALGLDGTGGGTGLPHDSYTPSNFQQLDDQDADLGSVSLALMPAPTGSGVAHLGVQTGKDAKLRLIDLDDMSGAGAPGHSGGEVQLLAVPQGGGVRAQQPAVWTDGEGVTWLFVGNSNGLSALTLGLQGSTPTLTPQWMKTGSASSPAIVNGILFVAGACTGGKCIIARGAGMGDVLWTSPVIGSLHWQSPIVVDGAVYVIDSSSTLWKFALPQNDTIFANGFETAP